MTRQLSRRDQIASAAMQGLLSNPEALGAINADSAVKRLPIGELVAQYSISYADELIRQLDLSSPSTR